MRRGRPAAFTAYDRGGSALVAGQTAADIRQAEATLHAATADIGVSVASLYPSISLTGCFGLRNTSTNYLFDWSSKFYSAGPSVSLPIFQGGALVANIKMARAAAAEAALN